MSQTPSFVEENTLARQHLVDVVNRLSDDQLSHPLEAGWTVSAVLAHLAFWDYRALVLLRKWKTEGISPSLQDTDVVNETTRVLCLAIPPRTAVDLATQYARAIDDEIEHLDPEMVAQVEAVGKTVRLDRAQHRREHLGQIEHALGTGSDG